MEGNYSLDYQPQVSIPPRKVSRPTGSAALRPAIPFPFHQGRFQGLTEPGKFPVGRRVSIPPRKVSRASFVPFLEQEISGFHSTKEGFKAGCRSAGTSSCPVSIPPRKVSRDASGFRELRRGAFPFHQGRFQGGSRSRIVSTHSCFHSTKEGFKAGGAEQRLRVLEEFPFHQGRFQGAAASHHQVSPDHVSIPPRKVSRCYSDTAATPRFSVSIPPRKVSRRLEPILAQRLLPCFHSTKEGFKGNPYRYSASSPHRFPFHQGRFQGARLLFPDHLSSTRFHSTKEGFKAVPVARNGPE